MAYNLGVTLDTIYNMSSKEYFGWIKYFKLRPIGWREDHRTAILTQTTYQGKKKLDINNIFPSLKVFSETEEASKNKARAFIDAMQSKTGNKIINTKD
ncbi:MAG: phage tail assembly protein T [Bdellovibrionales bacterium]